MTPALREGVRLLTDMNDLALADTRLFYCQETDKPLLPRMPWDKGRCALRYLVEPESRHALFWSDLHSHYRPLGLVGVADGADIISLNDVMDQFHYKAAGEWRRREKGEKEREGGEKACVCIIITPLLPNNALPLTPL